MPGDVNFSFTLDQGYKMMTDSVQVLQTVYFLFSYFHISSPLCILLFCEAKKPPSLHCICINRWGWVWGSVWLRELVRWWFGWSAETGNTKGEQVWEEGWCCDLQGRNVLGGQHEPFVSRNTLVLTAPDFRLLGRALWVGRISPPPPRTQTQAHPWPGSLNWWPLGYHYPRTTISFVTVSFYVKPALLWKWLFGKYRPFLL